MNGMRSMFRSRQQLLAALENAVRSLEGIGSSKVSHAETRFFSTSKAAQAEAGTMPHAARETPHPHYSAYVAIGAVGLGGAYYFYSKQPAGSALKAEIPLEDLPPSEQPHQIGEFEVMDHLGQRFTQDSLLGNFAVLFFGQIDHQGRRARLLQMADAVMQSDRMSNMHYLKPVFLTTDPETDDVVKMSAMVSDYASALNRKDVLHVRLAGVTGPDVAKVHEAAQAYTQTTVGKSPEAAAAAKQPGTNNDEGDLYLVNPDGQFIASYGPDKDSKEIGNDWAEIMKAYKQSNPTWHAPKKVATRHA